MKIFSAAQIRSWDNYTIINEPITSINLMERAATACYKWMVSSIYNTNNYVFFCGTGNNGADGLAIARLLLIANKIVSIFILEGENRSADFDINFDRIQQLTPNIHFLNIDNLPSISKEALVIDALFGAGINRPLHQFPEQLVTHINGFKNKIISIDLPSGLFPDINSSGNPVINASITLSFQTPKLAFFIPENNKYTGTVHVLIIGLHSQYYEETETYFKTIDEAVIRNIYQPRNQFLHKYNFGHALLYAGSNNMMGAAILCAKACLRSGAGLVTIFTSDGLQPTIHAALPEAITTTTENFALLSQKKSAIGIGPGLAISPTNHQLLKTVLLSYSGPFVIDASSLEMMNSEIDLIKYRTVNPPILTPHTGEFEKLFGKTANDFETVELAIKKAVEYKCYIILKGHYTLIACPDGNGYFNTTGNAGMATAGSGDVLTGILTGLLTQGYTQKNACILGVYLHGLAGDIAAEKISQEAMIASDIIDNLGEGFLKIRKY